MPDKRNVAISYVSHHDHSTNYVMNANGEPFLWNAKEAGEQVDLFNSYPAKNGKWVAVEQYGH